MRYFLLHSLALALAFTVAATAQAETFNWPQWQGPQRNSLSTETGLMKSWPDVGPKRRWMFTDCGKGYSGPAVVDGKLYIMGGRNGISEVIALDADTGSELWHTPLGPELQNDWGNGPRGTPTVDGKFIYVLSGTGTLACLRLTDGQEVWRVTMESLGGKVPHWGYTESPLVDGDLVLCTPGGAKGSIAALNKKTGKLVWQSADLDDGAHYASIMPAEFHGQKQYVQLLEKRLVGLDPKSGKLLWQVPWGGATAVIPTPIIVKGHVFVTSGYGAGCMLVKVDQDNNAEQVYENKLMKNHHGGVICLDEHIFGHSDGVGWLCLDLWTGEQVWREKEALGKGAISYGDGMFYCLGEEDGAVVLIEASAEGWKEHGRFTLDPQTKIRADRGRIWTHPVIVNGRLYLRDQDLLYCYEVKE